MTSFAFIGHYQAVAETLVVSLAVIVQNELVNSLAQCAFTEEDHSVQAGLLDAANETLRIVNWLFRNFDAIGIKQVV